MTYWLSRPVEALFGTDNTQPAKVNTLIIGSGYGAAMAALALSESDESRSAMGRVVVFERGEEYLPQDFPRTLGELPGYIPTNAGGKNNSALWDVRAGDGAVSIAGNGLGGTSLVNASVAVPPDKDTLDQWPAPEGDDGWHSLFSRCYPKIHQLLGVNEIDDPSRFAKYRALARTVQHIDSTAEVKAAPVAINFAGGGPHSVDHKPCNHCGNCVIGCHSGAKQSLNMNAWPLAVQQGVELFTGARVTRLSNSGPQWKVYFQSSRDTESELELVVDRVILAAGSIGSTEILSRSTKSQDNSGKSAPVLCLSGMLGEKFSANGDGLVFTSGEKDKVNAIADVPDESASAECGPTIVGIARTQSPDGSTGTLTIEDGAIPYPLAQIWREAITMQSFFQRFVPGERSAWHQDNNSHDYLATSNDFSKHGQVLLTMGFDGSPGRLVADESTGNLLPTWPNEKQRKGYYSRLHQLFSSQKPSAFSGGEYHPNPLYKLLPDKLTQAFVGAGDLPSNIVTVHPLGGCVIGETASTGVINQNGQVFRCDCPQDKTALYENLYVLDGAALPGPVGVNPMIAISALSYTLASRIAGKAEPLATPFEKLLPENRVLPDKQTQLVRREKTVNARFSERLLWRLSDLSIDTKSELNSLFQNRLPEDTKTVVLDVTFYFDDEKHEGRDFYNSLDKWLCNPVAPLRATAVLRSSNREVLHGSADTFVPTPELMRFTGTVTLGSRDEEKNYSRFYRTTTAVSRFAFYRTYGLFGSLLGGLKKSKQDQLKQSVWEKVLETVGGFLRIAKIHSDWRYLEYSLIQKDCNDTPLKISGRKKLAYTLSAPSLWQSLLYLKVQFSRNNTRLSAEFAVDLLRITRGPSPLQVTKSTDEPTSVAAVMGFGLLLARLLGTTHFWSFGAHNYAKFDTSDKIDDQRLRPPPETTVFKKNEEFIRSLPVDMHELKVPEYQLYDSGNKVDDETLARLLRYREDESDRPAVLLVHGLSHSSEIYWPEHVDETYVQFLLGLGYDVWVFDHRTSANTRRNINIQHTWDDIALVDIPWAVGLVFSEINKSNVTGKPRLVNVFSHCIGAGAVAMSVLAGKLQQPGVNSKSMLGSLVPHAVTPWVFSSCENRTRANLWGYVKDFGILDKIDPRMHSKPTGLHTMLDRIASSTIDLQSRRQWPWFWSLIKCKPGENEYAMAMYFRYTVFWGKQWVHHNVHDKLKKRFPTMVGEVPASILQQTFFGVRRKRLASKDAENKYVTEQNFHSYWTFPTLFFHGEENQVFDVESSRLSAYKLVELRQRQTTATEGHTAVTTSDYTRHGVCLKTVPGYGHMDIIIGKKATAEVGDYIHKFFQASEQHSQERNHQTTAETNYDVFKNCLKDEGPGPGDYPLTRTRPGKFPYTGPVLSYANDKSFRVWVEADDYDTVSPSGLSVSADNCIKVDTRQLPFKKSPAGQHGNFLGVEISNPQQIRGAMQVGIMHPGDIDNGSAKFLSCNNTSAGVREHAGSQDHGRQRDIDHDHGATIELYRMPWFQRLYHQGVQAQSENISFLVGSCLHPGLTFTRDLSDSIFELMWQQITEADGVDFLLLAGDQIYADATAGVFDPKASYERFRQRYREAYSARGLRRVLSHLPTYFVVDDHAYKDNFSGLTDVSKARELSIAKAEARNFQTHLNNTSELWSDFEVSGQPFFCFDTRFERTLDDSRMTREALIGCNQASAFEKWVDSNKHKKALFLCTGSPLFPIKSEFVRYPVLASYSDTLVAYPGFLKYLVSTLAGLECRIYMLSGDPHLSCRGEGTLSCGGREVKIDNIVSSPLNAPFPFANAKAADFSWNVDQELELPKTDVSLTFRQDLLSTAPQQFCRMEYNALSGNLDVKVVTSEGVRLAYNRRSIPEN